MVIKKGIGKKGAKEIAKKVKPKPKPKTRPSSKANVRNQTAKPNLNLTSKAKPVQPNKVNPGLAGTAAAGATVGTGLAISARKNKGESFDDAFRKARAKGEGTLFTHNGKKYTAVTKDDLKKKGYATDTAGLAAYNRAGGKKKIVPAPNKTELTRKQKRKQRRKERIGFETFKERRQARKTKRKTAKNPSKSSNQPGVSFKSGGIVSSKKSTPRGVGAAKRGFGKALK